MLRTPHIILADNHLRFRESIKSILTNKNIAYVIGEENNGIELMELLLYLRPDLVLMNIDIPQMNSIEATQKSIELIPDLKIIACTMFGEDDKYQNMIALGIKGFIIKSGNIIELENAISELMEGKTHFSATFQLKIIDTFENIYNNHAILCGLPISMAVTAITRGRLRLTLCQMQVN